MRGISPGARPACSGESTCGRVAPASSVHIERHRTLASRDLLLDSLTIHVARWGCTQGHEREARWRGVRTKSVERSYLDAVRSVPSHILRLPRSACTQWGVSDDAVAAFAPTSAVPALSAVAHIGTLHFRSCWILPECTETLCISHGDSPPQQRTSKTAWRRPNVGMRHRCPF